MSGKARQIKLGPLCVMWGLYPGGWFRLFGWGLALSNHNSERPLFSERYNGQFGIRHTYVHIGPWCIKPLRRPETRRPA